MDALRDRVSSEAPPAAGRDPLRTTFSALAFGLLPLLLLGGFVIGAIGHRFAFDFHTFWDAARTVAKGHSPYPSPATVAHAHPADGDYEYFVYPPPFVLGVLPLAALPFGLAAAVWTVALVGCIVATLWILDVRDWRCYGLAFAAVPMLSALRLGAVTPLLMLLAALAWRYRNSTVKAGGAVGCAIVIKLFLWPLALWLLVTRRWRAAAFAVGGAGATTALAWAVLGFDGLRDYPTLLRTLSSVEGRETYSLVALTERLQLPDPSRSWLLLAVPIALALVWASRVVGRRDTDATLFGAAIGVALLLSPIVWLNYFALLLVPIALRRKALGIEWGLLAMFWLTPSPEPAAHPLWQLVLVTVLVVVLTVGLRAKAQQEAVASADAPNVRGAASSHRRPWRSREPAPRAALIRSRR